MPSAPDLSTNAAPPRPRRWLKRLCWTGLIGVGGLATGLGLVWQQREALVRRWLAQIPGAPTIGDIKIEPQSGWIELKSVNWRSTSQSHHGMTSFQAEGVRIEGNWRDWLQRRATKVRLDQPKVTFRGESQPKAKDESPETTAFGLMVDEVEVNQASVSLESLAGWSGAIVGSLKAKSLVMGGGGLSAEIKQLVLAPSQIRHVEGQQLQLTSPTEVALEVGTASTPWRIRELAFPEGGLIATWSINGNVVSGELGGHVQELHFGGDQPFGLSAPTIKLRKLRSLSAASQEVLGDIPEATFGLTKSEKGWEVASISIPKATLVLLEEWLQPKIGSAEPNVASSSALVPWSVGEIHLGEFDLTLPTIKRSDWPVTIPRCRLQGSFHGGKLSSDGRSLEPCLTPQALEIKEGQLRLPSLPEATPWCQWEKVAVSVIPEEWVKQRRLGKAEIQGLNLALSPDVLTELAPPAAPASLLAGPTATSTPAPPALPTIDSLTIQRSSLSVSGFDGPVPHLKTDVEAETTKDPTNTPVYSITLRQFEAVAPKSVMPRDKPLLSPSVAKVKEIKAQTSALQLQSQRIEQLEISGAEISIGAALKALLARERPASPWQESFPTMAKVIGPTTPEKDWMLGAVTFKDSSASLQDIIPLLLEVTVPLKATFTEVPLSESGLRLQSQPQRIEVGSVPLYTSYGSAAAALFNPIAQFDSNFIHFTFAGLMEHRLDKIEVVSPLLIAGQPMFWWVDYVRKYASAGHSKEAQLAATQDTAALEKLSQERREQKEKGWSADLIEARHGRLRLALPGGIADLLPDLPFRAQSQMDRGLADLQLVVPAGRYRPIKDVPLEIDVEKGEIIFNYPLKETSNNLVQTFRLKELRFKDFAAQNVWMTVTFDEKGIYGKFGGETYQGYSNGGFDLYFDDPVSWDAWATIQDLELDPFSAKVFPTYARLNGRGSLEVKAWGDLDSLHRVTGRATLGAGSMELLCLDPLKDKFPSHWSLIESRLAEIGLALFRTYPFSAGSSDFRLRGKEGVFSLQLNSPQGLRRFEVNLRDHQSALGHE